MELVPLVCVVVLVCRGALASTIVVPTSNDYSDARVDDGSNTLKKPNIEYLHVDSDIRFRFAHTEVSSKIANPASSSQEVIFTATIPEDAFISGFLIEVDGQVYKAYVKEKEEAKKEYTEAVRQGKTAAHVAFNPRDSNRFTVSVNVEPQKRVTFNLTYEELLSRELGTYKHVINLDPGQIVQDLSVEVRINESADITILNVPALRTSNEIDANSTAVGVTNPLAVVERPSPSSAVVRFAPTPEQQRQLASEGIKGQLCMNYDVNRIDNPEQVLVNDGYFVHFFAPTGLPPLPKHVTFILDVSGSMEGRKIEQLRQAMTTILGDLNQGDYFSIVLFSTEVTVWDPTLSDSDIEKVLDTNGGWGYHSKTPQASSELSQTVIAAANQKNLDKAKEFVGKLTAQSSTNIYGALIKGLDIAKLGNIKFTSSEDKDERPEPIIIFLTDGQPNVGVYNTDNIVKGISEANSGGVSIFSLAFGDDADIDFLNKLSLRNQGFERKIYEASDAFLQLRDFYRQLASPLLAHVKFVYEPNQVVTDSVTRHVFRTFFSGSELVVSGCLVGDDLSGHVEGRTSEGWESYPIHPIILPPRPIHVNYTEKEPGLLERMYAYLSIKQLLEDDKMKDHSSTAMSPEKQKALDLALKNSLVTELTSLVVVKPNGTSSAETEDASKPVDDDQDLSMMSGHLNSISGGSYSAFVRPQGSYDYEDDDESLLETEAYDDIEWPADSTESVLATIDDILWLPALSPNNTISLPVGDNGEEQNLKIALGNETDTEFSACRTPYDGDGHCRHLRYCVLPQITTSVTDFMPYFCEIQSSSGTYVGTCCPDYVGLITK